MTKTLYIRLLGPVSISIGDDDPLHFSSSRGELFVAYLAVTALHQARETLATFLWDDRSQKQSFSNLRSLLAQLPDEVKPYIDANRKTISLAEGMSVWVDALAFEEMLQREPSPEQTAEALELYRGDFLDGQFVKESRGLEEWMALTRERLQLLAIRAHQQMARYYLHRRGYAQGIFHTQELLRLDPLQEGALRLLMRLLVRAGQRNTALTQYRSFRQNLTAELGVEPAAETVTLYERIRLAKEPIPHKLPVTLTPFIGREEELAQLEARLDDPTCQLITLVGPGGTGKTRLAIATADRRQGEYLNGIFFVSLIGIETAADLPTAVARALDMPLDGKLPPHQQLLRYLREKELLLILDNFEHILDEAAAFVQEILTSAPAVKLLITSRERLYLRAEWLLEIIGLAYPELPLGLTDEAEILAHYAAVRLFTSTAQRVQAEFALQPALEAVIQICELVEGNPLAIELAAA
ncbi:MAG: AAA family ATPase, partial [Anaerolineales bacterium]|nr:AAA family ATPase [Anaerolineales bacterium]